jgi:hypothetical protein
MITTSHGDCCPQRFPESSSTTFLMEDGMKVHNFAH